MSHPASGIEPPLQARVFSLTRVASDAVDSLIKFIERYRVLLLLSATIAYFAITAYRAQRRLFWFDEIFTLYISRLSGVQSIWRACTHGVDFNPPLLYLFTRWSQDLFGATELGARVPQIITFWIFCLSLYRFVSFRTNALGGFIALLLPLTTQGYWYAYEARSHGLTLGFFGLALISWQAASRSDRRPFWVCGLAASLTAAALCHCYSFLIFIPLGFGELTRTILRRRFDTAVWAALVSPAVIAAATVLSLLLPARASVHAVASFSNGQGIWRISDLSFDPRLAVAFLLVASIAALWKNKSFSRAETTGSRDSIAGFAWYEFAALFSILCTPLVAFVAGRLAHTPVFARYELIVLGAIASLVGGAFSRYKAAGLLALSLTVLWVARGFLQFYNGDEVTEPSSGSAITTRQESLNEEFRWIGSHAQGGDPIVLSDFLAFAPLFHYAPSGLRPRLTFLIPEGPLAPLGEYYLRLQSCCGAPGTVSSEPDFLAAHSSFFMYGAPALVASQSYTLFSRVAGQVRAVTCFSGNCLFHVVLGGGAAAPPASQSEGKRDRGK